MSFVLGFLQQPAWARPWVLERVSPARTYGVRKFTVVSDERLVDYWFSCSRICSSARRIRDNSAKSTKVSPCSVVLEQ